MIPISPGIAVRINMLSVVGAAASVFVAYWLILRVAVGWGEDAPGGFGKVGAGIAALTGSIIMGFSRTFWSSAVEAEVYTLSMFLMLLANYLIFRLPDALFPDPRCSKNAKCPRQRGYQNLPV